MVRHSSPLAGAFTALLGLVNLAHAFPNGMIRPRQTPIPGLERCTSSTFDAVVAEFGGSLAPRSPYTSNTEPYSGNDAVLVWATRNTAINIPDICGVRIAVTGNVAFEIYLPSPQRWNRRFLTVGNGGFAGRTSRVDMFSRAVHGWAVMSTNVGHEDASGGMSWAANNESLQIDWAWKAMASSVPYAKAIVAAYYQNVSAVGNYYSGCSTGGRQGIRQVEVDANSFDGMLIGAPAWNVRSAMPVLSRIGWLGQTSGLKISPTDTLLLQRIYNRVYERCNVIGFDNTANDGAIRDSVACLDLFRQSGVSGPVWSGLDCDNNSPAANCVTLSQRQAFMTLLEEFKAPKAPGEDPSYAGDGFDISGIKGLTTFLTQQSLTDFDQQFSRYFLNETIVWDSDENGTRLITRSEEWDARVRANADPAILRGWRGKTILYTGTADGTVSSLGTRRAFNLAGGTSNTKLAYFELPGMPHCADSGNGGENPPWYIGGVGISLANGGTWFMPNTTTPPLNNTEHDALVALTEWVEGGPGEAAPTKLTATAFSNLASYTISKRRPICAAPKRQNYNAGDINSPESWSCVAA